MLVAERNKRFISDYGPSKPMRQFRARANESNQDIHAAYQAESASAFVADQARLIEIEAFEVWQDSLQDWKQFYSYLFEDQTEEN